MIKPATHIKHTFTLIELMVVIAIISIILAITVPAFRQLVTGNSVDAAARMLSSQLMLARAEAISKRQCIAIVIPGKDFTQLSTDLNNYNYNSFRAAIVEPNSGNKYTFTKWVEGTQWTFLPTNSTIAALELDSNAFTKSLKDANTTPDGKFIPTGTVNDGNTIITVSDSNSNAMVVTTDSNNNTVNQNQSNPVRAIVFKPNGRCVDKCYVTIMEGTSMGGTIDRQNKYNIRVFEINKYTGQIKYLF